jgi:peptidyl-prolyl cis-trans isomerase SurA
VGRIVISVTNVLRLVVVLSLISLYGQVSFAGEAVPLVRVVAIVGDSAITSYDLDKEVSAVKKQFQANNATLPNENELRRQVLERIISRKILLDFADRSGIRVSSEEVAATINGIAREEKKSTPEFLAALEHEGGDTLKDFRRRVEADLKINNLRRRELDSRIKVSETEIDLFLQRLADTPIRNQYLAAHILVKGKIDGDSSEREKALEKASEAIKRIDEGVDFRRVAAELSDASDALEGGLLGWRYEEELPTLFMEKLASMKLGRRSDIFESPNGLHILFLYDKKGADQKVVVEQTHVSHILIKIDQYEDENIVRSRAEEIRDRLVLGGEDFATLAKNLSADISAANGGDLGWLGPGETVPEFERAMNALNNQEISDVIRSQFGFHIIFVHGRRDADLSEDRKRALALQTITQRKLESRFEGWVQELRDKTFVELKL